MHTFFITNGSQQYGIWVSVGNLHYLFPFCNCDRPRVPQTFLFWARGKTSHWHPTIFCTESPSFLTGSKILLRSRETLELLRQNYFCWLKLLKLERSLKGLYKQPKSSPVPYFWWAFLPMKELSCKGWMSWELFSKAWGEDQRRIGAGPDRSLSYCCYKFHPLCSSGYKAGRGRGTHSQPTARASEDEVNLYSRPARFPFLPCSPVPPCSPVKRHLSCSTTWVCIYFPKYAKGSLLAECQAPTTLCALFVGGGDLPFLLPAFSSQSGSYLLKCLFCLS